MRILALFALLLPIHNGFAKNAPKTAQQKGNIERPSTSSVEAWEKYRQPMIDISRQLGVTCTYCHDSKNYRDGSKATYQTAKKHMQVIDMLNNQFKTAFSEKVDCFMCHHGTAKPDFKEKPEKF